MVALTSKRKIEELAFVPDRALLEGLADGGFVNADDPSLIAHVDAGFIRTQGKPDADGDIEAELTHAARDWLWANDAPKPPKGPKAALKEPKTSRRSAARVEVASISPEIDDYDPSIAPPTGKRPIGARRYLTPVRDVLALDALEIGQSRHIAATEAVPEPWNSLTGTISAINRTYATPKLDAAGNVLTRERKTPRGKSVLPVLVYAKKFRLYKASPNDPRGPGARILRVEVDSI